MSTLQENLKNRIAKAAGIEPQQVNSHLIASLRAALYQNSTHKFFWDGENGGVDDGTGLETQNLTEIERESVEADAIIARILADT